MIMTIANEVVSIRQVEVSSTVFTHILRLTETYTCTIYIALKQC